MARTLNAGHNELKLWDNISNSELIIYYRDPTTKERQDYQNMAVQRKRNKVVFRQVEAKVKYGLAVITGFRDGDFVRNVDGQDRPMASEPASDNYHEQWKEELERFAADIVMIVASHVFDAPTEITESDSGDVAGN